MNIADGIGDGTARYILDVDQVRSSTGLDWRVTIDLGDRQANFVREDRLAALQLAAGHIEHHLLFTVGMP